MLNELDRARPPMVLTFDVEDWDHANYDELKGRKAEITRLVLHRQYDVEKNIDRWVELLGEAGARSTCFVLGDFAQRYPSAVRKLEQAGHEIASHSYTHDLIHGMSREEFREQLKRSLGLLGELTGKRPEGFRAPNWSVDPLKTPWFCEELESQGVRYDSSEFPVKTPLFGNSSAPLAPYRVGNLTRVPVPVFRMAGVRLPFSSGAFFRLSPLWALHWGLKRAEKQGQPPMVVLHPRELDPDHPRLPITGWRRRMHYANLETTEPKLRSLLAGFRGIAIEDYLRERGDSGSV